MVLTAAVKDGEDLLFVDPLEEEVCCQPSGVDRLFVLGVGTLFVVLLLVSAKSTNPIRDYFAPKEFTFQNGQSQEAQPKSQVKHLWNFLCLLSTLDLLERDDLLQLRIELFVYHGHVFSFFGGLGFFKVFDLFMDLFEEALHAGREFKDILRLDFTDIFVHFIFNRTGVEISPNKPIHMHH